MGIFLQGESLYQYHRRINTEHNGNLPRACFGDAEPFIESRGPRWSDNLVHLEGRWCRCDFGGEFAGYDNPANFYRDYVLAVLGRLEVAA